MGEGSWVGLDVHARSVVAGVIDAGSGEVRSLRVAPGSEGTVGADRVRACACVRGGGAQLRCGGVVADPGGGRSGQD
jgi:hypothetical protein